ncbi:MAG: carbohydrate porin [Chthoniobacter sp.]
MRLHVLPLLAFAGVAAVALAGDDPPPPSAGGPPVDVLTGDWSGVRCSLANHGVVPSLSYLGEVMGNTTGGFRRATIYEGLVTFGLDVDLQKLVGWQGAKFHVAGLDPHGAGLTQKALRDVGVVSSADAYDGVRLDTLWLEQSFGNQRFSLRAGLLAVDDEFYQTASEAGLHPCGFWLVVDSRFECPVAHLPILRPGARLKMQPTRWSYAMVGAYGGNPAPGVFHDPSPDAVPSTDFNKHGTQWSLRRDEGAFLIAEGAVHFNDPADPVALCAPAGDGKKAATETRGLFTSVKAGVAYDTDTFSDAYDAELIGLGSAGAPARARARGGDWAVYALADRELYREPGTDAQGLSAFVHATYMPPDRNAYDFAGEAGLNYTGLLPRRGDDVFGLACAIIHASASSADAVRDANRADGTHLATPDYEGVLEATYNAHLRPGVWLQPDVQFILHPGATSERGNALVIGLRTTITF